MKFFHSDFLHGSEPQILQLQVTAQSPSEGQRGCRDALASNPPLDGCVSIVCCRLDLPVASSIIYQKPQ